MVKDYANANLSLIEMPTEDLNQFPVAESSQLGRKMDAIAHTMIASPLLDEKILSNTLRMFRETEVTMEPAKMLRYYNVRSGSSAVLTLVTQLKRATKLFKNSDDKVVQDGFRRVSWFLQAIEVMVANS